MISKIYYNELLSVTGVRKIFFKNLVIAQKAWSKINEVEYWTNGKGWKEINFLCRSCLKAWYDEDPKEIKKKLNRLLESFQEALLIEADNPETWDADTLYNLTAELKETLEILQDKKTVNLDEKSSVYEEGLCSLIENYQSEEEE